MCTLVGRLYQYWEGAPFARKTALILCGTDSKRYWKRSFWDSVPCVPDCIRLFLQICQLHVNAANLLFYHMPKLFYWIQIWWLGRPLKNFELLVLFIKPVWDYFCFVTWCMIMLEIAIRRWVHCGHGGVLHRTTDPQGRWFDPWCGQEKICTAVGPLSKAINLTLLQGVLT